MVPSPSLARHDHRAATLPRSNSIPDGEVSSWKRSTLPSSVRERVSQADNTSAEPRYVNQSGSLQTLPGPAVSQSAMPGPTTAQPSDLALQIQRSVSMTFAEKKG